jgi:hydrogenase maturation protein HypF
MNSNTTSSASMRPAPNTASPETSSRQTRLMRVQGTVQGVGFRPFVYRLALDLGVTGWVLNDALGVTIEATADAITLERFKYALESQAPLAAHVERVAVLETVPTVERDGFSILESRTSSLVTALISPDLPICADCLRELRDPSDRRYRYPFINCTNCGPRYSIIESLPYDRPRTTMRTFQLCEACAAEYHDPLNRRFHAQPVACPHCGPTLVYRHADGELLARGEAVIECAVSALSAGQILAIKGLGGYHLVCDARDEPAVIALRERKFRKEKPFALMARDIDALEGIVEVSSAACVLLESPARPIVLLPKGPRTLPTALAPDNADLGVMLPYTPLHHLLFDAGAPELLVMTSANRSSEPIAYRDDEALERLRDLADAFVIGEREIARRVDDSVTTIVAGAPCIVRRARGYAPEPVLRSPRLEKPTLGVGADLKSSVTLAVGGYAFVSQHLGDLEQLDALEAFEATIHDLCDMYRVSLEEIVIAHDLHPNYASTRAARTMSSTHVAVQHHRAHIASVLAERFTVNAEAWSVPVLGFAFDGTGLGDDGSIWGGEVFHGSLETGFERVAHLRHAALPGGDAAARHPVQAAIGFLSSLGEDAVQRLLEPPFAFPAERIRVASNLIRSSVNTPLTSSMGRLFDTVSALTGFTRAMSFEGQAAIRLEALARTVAPQRPYPFPFDGHIWDYAPLLERIVGDVRSGIANELIARRFHDTVAHGILAATRSLAHSKFFKVVVLSGGVFQNRLLTETALGLLERDGFDAWINRRVPPNDGGISLGQVALAVANQHRQEA